MTKFVLANVFFYNLSFYKFFFFMWIYLKVLKWTPVRKYRIPVFLQK